MLQILIISIHHAHPILVIIFPPDLKKKKNTLHGNNKKTKTRKTKFFRKNKKKCVTFWLSIKYLKRWILCTLSRAVDKFCVRRREGSHHELKREYPDNKWVSRTSIHPTHFFSVFCEMPEAQQVCFRGGIQLVDKVSRLRPKSEDEIRS